MRTIVVAFSNNVVGVFTDSSGLMEADASVSMKYSDNKLIYRRISFYLSMMWLCGDLSQTAKHFIRFVIV